MALHKQTFVVNPACDREATHFNGFDRCRPLRPWKRQRRGSFLIEAAVSLALLGTALIATTRLARLSTQLSLQSDQRTAAHLAGLNTLERIQALPDEEWMDQVTGIAADVSEATGCSVEVAMDPMASPPGQHLTVNVEVNENVQISLHDWRLNPAPATRASEDEQPDGDKDAGSSTDADSVTDSSVADDGDADQPPSATDAGDGQ